jgi:hypothetical protein
VVQIPKSVVLAVPHRIKQEREDKAKATVQPKQATAPKGGRESRVAWRDCQICDYSSI